jgi:hypothetical protein
LSRFSVPWARREHLVPNQIDNLRDGTRPTGDLAAGRKYSVEFRPIRIFCITTDQKLVGTAVDGLSRQWR